MFDSAYDGNSTNEAIYGDICYSLVESVLEGYNSTIFAYGQTGELGFWVQERISGCFQLFKNIKLFEILLLLGLKYQNEPQNTMEFKVRTDKVKAEIIKVKSQDQKSFETTKTIILNFLFCWVQQNS